MQRDELSAKINRLVDIHGLQGDAEKRAYDVSSKAAERKAATDERAALEAEAKAIIIEVGVDALSILERIAVALETIANEPPAPLLAEASDAMLNKG